MLFSILTVHFSQVLFHLSVFLFLLTFGMHLCSLCNRIEYAQSQFCDRLTTSMMNLYDNNDRFYQCICYQFTRLILMLGDNSFVVIIVVGNR